MKFLVTNYLVNQPGYMDQPEIFWLSFVYSLYTWINLDPIFFVYIKSALFYLSKKKKPRESKECQIYLNSIFCVLVAEMWYKEILLGLFGEPPSDAWNQLG